MKKVLLLRDKHGKFWTLIKDFDLFNLNMFDSIDFLYTEIIKWRHLFSKDSLAYFRHEVTKDDEISYLNINKTVVYIDRKNKKKSGLYSLSYEDWSLHKREDAKFYIYRGFIWSIVAHLGYLLKYNLWNLEVPPKKEYNVIFSTKINPYTFLSNDLLEFTPSRIVPLSCSGINIEFLLETVKYFINWPIVIKEEPTCLWKWITFFKQWLEWNEEQFAKAIRAIQQRKNDFVIQEYIPSTKEIRIYFVVEEWVVHEIFSIIKTKQEWKETHHSNGVLNYEFIDIRAVMGEQKYSCLEEFILHAWAKAGAMDILIGEDEKFYIMENNGYADVLASDKVELAMKRLEARAKVARNYD